MRILVIGGMHGNEPLGLAVAQLFKQKPVNGVGAVLANKLAIEADSRFTGQDLNRSFPGDSKSTEYEPRRAAQLLKMTRDYDLVLDFHNTHCPDNDCGFVGQSANDMVCKAASFLGLNRIIVADYDCINKYAPNCLSVEVSLSSTLNDPQVWYYRISQLSELESLDGNTDNVEKYSFVYRMTLEDRDRFDLLNQNLKAFEPIRANLAEKLGVASPAYPIFIADKFTPYNYGGLLNRM